jgi:predicted dienelactone hydrolase
MARLAAGLVAFLLTAGACGSSTETTTGTGSSTPTSSTPESGHTTSAVEPPAPTTSEEAEPQAPAELSVGEVTLDLVDPGRPTPAGAASAAAPDRQLPTTVWYPEADGTYPLIVFAHGLSGHPDVFTRLLSRWASAGYVVAAPAFPLTNDTVEGSAENWADVANQPGDMSFVLDEMLAAADDPTQPFAGRVDPDRIGFGGLSLGGATTYLAGLNEATRDPRVDAAVVLAGVAGRDDETGTFLEPSGVPALLMHGDRDPAAPIETPTDAYELLQPPKYFVVLLGAGHAEPFQDQVTIYDELIDTVTVDFWDAWLRGDPGAAARPVAGAQVDGLATLTYDAG